MKKRDNFTVTCPKLMVRLCTLLIAIFIVIAVLSTIFSDPHPLLYVNTVIIIFIPCTWSILWAKLFKITVKGSMIYVRRHNGMKYSLDVSEIVRVDRKIVPTGMMARNEITTVRTASRRFKLETLMDGSDKMIAYLLENVDSSKIHITGDEQ